MDPAQLLCDTGRLLLREGLVYRSWGNFSLRLGDGDFLITPSGLNYQDMTPQDLVAIEVSSGRYSGQIEPSSERELHRILYSMDDHVKAVLHTHQPIASVVASRGRDMIVPHAFNALLGQLVPCCSYAPSGSAKLSRRIKSTLGNVVPSAFLFSNHGAVITGRSIEEALKRAYALEEACDEYISQYALKKSDGAAGNAQDRLEYFKRKHPRRRKL